MRRLTRLSILPCVVLVFAACEANEGGEAAPAAAPRTVFGGERPAVLQVPVAYDGTADMSLLVVLHGYTGSGLGQQRYFGLDSLVNTRGVLLVAPDGTVDARGSRFWNATDACCDLGASGVDDVAYLKDLIADIRRDYRVDPKRIYVIGHSNGGFMAHRLACEYADGIAAVVSLAGATWEDPARCTPTSAVSVLNIHGDVDRTIRYEAGEIGGHAYPSASVTLERWRGHDGCLGGQMDDPVRLDLEVSLAGEETVVSRAEGCPAGVDVELWTIRGGGHVPDLQPSFVGMVWEWLAAHPKP